MPPPTTSKKQSGWKAGGKLVPCLLGKKSLLLQNDRYSIKKSFSPTRSKLCGTIEGEWTNSREGGFEAKHQVVVSSDSRSPPDSTDGTSKGHRDGEWKGEGGDTTPETEEARGRTRSRAWRSETEAAAGRAAALTLLFLFRDTSVGPPRDTSEVSGMQRGNEAHERPRERRDRPISLSELPRKEVSGNRCRGSRPTSIARVDTPARTDTPNFFPSSISVKSCIYIYKHEISIRELVYLFLIQYHF